MKTRVWGEPEIKTVEFLFQANIEIYNLEHFFQCKFDEIRSGVLHENQEGAHLLKTQVNQENVCPDARS